MTEEGYVWVDSDEVLAEVCENRHGQDNIGGEVKEMEPVGVHDVTEELREGRAEPAVEEQREEGVSLWSPFRSRSGGGEYLGARMRSRLRRPEEVEPLPYKEVQLPLN